MSKRYAAPDLSRGVGYGDVGLAKSGFRPTAFGRNTHHLRPSRRQLEEREERALGILNDGQSARLRDVSRRDHDGAAALLQLLQRGPQSLYQEIC